MVCETLHRPQLGDLALQASVSVAIEAGVFDTDRELSGNELQERNLVIRKLAAMEREEIDDSNQDFWFFAAPQDHWYRHLRRIDVFARCRNRNVCGMVTGVGRGNDATLRGRGTGDTVRDVASGRRQRPG